MKQSKPTVVMMLDQAFGTLRLASENESVTVAGIDLAPGTAHALSQLKEVGSQTILVAVEPLQRDSLQGLRQFLPDVDKIVAYDKDLTQTLDTCVSKFSINLRRSVFVAVDRVSRGAATAKGTF